MTVVVVVVVVVVVDEVLLSPVSGVGAGAPGVGFSVGTVTTLQISSISGSQLQLNILLSS